MAVGDSGIDVLQEVGLGVDKGSDVDCIVAGLLVGDTSKCRIEAVLHLVFTAAGKQRGDLRPLRAILFKQLKKFLILLFCPH